MHLQNFKLQRWIQLEAFDTKFPVHHYSLVDIFRSFVIIELITFFFFFFFFLFLKIYTRATGEVLLAETSLPGPETWHFSCQVLCVLCSQKLFLSESIPVVRHTIKPVYVCLFVLRFYGPVNPMGSCRARSVYLTTHLLGRLSPLSG